MNEKDEIISEILPFLQELLPGLSASFIMNSVKIIFSTVSLLLVFFILSHLIIYFKERFDAKKYLRNLPLLKELEGFDSETRKVLLTLVERCVVLGAEIDFHTNRKNNSKTISRLVYEILSGSEILDRILFSAASMVYDAGFLDIRQSLFHSEILSKKEKALLNTHVARGISHFDFVPREYRRIFLEASFFHHENQDGSGFPEGLKGDDIPYIARIIHAAESYNSLVNRKKSLKELKRMSSKYDAGVLRLLEKVRGRI